MGVDAVQPQLHGMRGVSPQFGQKPLVNNDTAANAGVDKIILATEDAPAQRVPAGLASVYFGGTAKGAVAPGLSFDSLFANTIQAAKASTFKGEGEVISFRDYMAKAFETPSIVRTPAQRIYDMVVAQGVGRETVDGQPIFTYNFYSNPADPDDAISGMKLSIHNFMKAMRAAADEGSTGKRIVLLVGPVGTAKTTLVDNLKRGLEEYTRTDEGAMYALQWDLKGLKDAKDENGKLLFADLPEVVDSPMNEDPLLVLSNMRTDRKKATPRQEFISALNERHRSQYKAQHGQDAPYNIFAKGDLSPASQDILDRLKAHYKGDMEQVYKHVKAKRIALDEGKQVGLTTFEPADEKSLKRGDLSGETNLRKLMEYGTDSNPHAFDYAGTIPRCNRGIGHFDELLKLPLALMYPLLTASEKKKIKAPNFPLISYDGVLIGTTNIPDWEKVKANKHMEAIRSRIAPVVVPYNSRVDDEKGIYEKGFMRQAKRNGVHVNPHSLDAAALWAVMSRLADPPPDLTMIQKARLYNGEAVKGKTDKDVIQMKEDVPSEAQELLKGVSPRTVQNALENVLQNTEVISPEGTSYKSIHPLQVVDALRSELRRPPSEGDNNISNFSKEEIERFDGFLNDVETEVKALIRQDVQRAMSGNEEDLTQVFDKYIKEVMAFNDRNKVEDERTGRMRDPDETFMRSIEAKMGVNDNTYREFRGTLIKQIASYDYHERQKGTGNSFNYKTDQKLRKALEEYLMDKHSDFKVPLLAKRNLASKADQEKIETIKARLIADFGYDSLGAEMALDIAGSPENRGATA